MFFYNRAAVLLILCLALASTAHAQTEPVFYGEEVIVTAGRYPQFVADVPWSVTVIDADEIKALGAVNVGDAVKLTTGVDVKSEGGLGALSSVKLRGSTSSQVVIMVDGMRVNSVLLGEANPGDILVSDIERIEIVRSPLSALWGADAVGGVINVITKRKTTGSRRTQILVSGGTYSTYKFNLSDSFSKENIDYRLNAGYIETAGFRQNSNHSSQKYLFGSTFHLAQDASVDIVLDQFIAERGTPFSSAAPMPNARRWDDNIRMGLSYTAKLDDKSDMEANVYNVRLKQVFNYDTTALPDETYVSDSTLAEIRNVLEVDPSWKLSWGVEMKNDHGISDAAGDNVISNKALYIQSENRISDQISLTFGARGDSSSHFDSALSPRAGAVWRVNDMLAFRSSYGLSYRAPSQNDLFWYQLVRDSFLGMDLSYELKGNPDLMPERGDMFDLAVEFTPNPGTKITLTGYESTTKDLIRWQETYFSTDWSSYYISTWEAMNVASANTEGFEVSVEQDLTDLLAVFANYTNESAMDISGQKVLDYAPREKYNAGVRYRDQGGTAASLSLRHVGERYADKDNTRKLKPYSVIDASLSKEFGDFEASLTCENLADITYEETEGYPMPGRAVHLGVSMKLF